MGETLMWKIAQQDFARSENIARALNLHPVIAQVMINRGIEDRTHIHNFLNPSLHHLPDPFLLPFMEEAVLRIIRAIDEKEKIVLYGDFDTDGVTSVALLHKFFKEVGIDAGYFIPNRMEHGYGLSLKTLKHLDDDIDLLITVDTGSRDDETIERLVSSGADVIITDHHQIDSPPKGALAVVNPKLPFSKYPFSDLSGCGVAFCLVMAVRKRMRELGMLKKEPNLKDMMGLVALSTIADVVPLIGVNRVFVKVGLDVIMERKNPGIIALMEASGITGVLTSEHVAYRMSPRINAAGRVDDAGLALKLLLSDEDAQCRDFASALNRLNSQRQGLENRILQDAKKRLLKVDTSAMSSIVLHHDEWHLGVMGIAASRLSDQFKLPTAIISREGKYLRGSVRSALGVNLMEVLNGCVSSLIRFGGHVQAAGITLEPEKLTLFEEMFENMCSKHIPDVREDVLTIDKVLEPEQIDGALLNEIGRLEPFGEGNREPIFAMKGAQIASKRIVGENHLKLVVKSNDRHFDAIGFGLGDMLDQIPSSADVAFTLQFNTWQGVKSIQLKLADILLQKK